MLIVHEVLARVGRQCFPKEVSHYAHTPRPQLGDDILSSSHSSPSFTHIHIGIVHRRSYARRSYKPTQLCAYGVSQFPSKGVLYI